MSLILVPVRAHTYRVVMADFLSGMQKHPISGFGLLQNVEISENPGMVKIKNRTILDYTPSNLIIAEKDDNYGNRYALSSDGFLYRNSVQVQAGLNSPWDIEIHKDYVCVAYADKIGFYGPVNNTPGWLGIAASGFATNYNGKLLSSIDPVLGPVLYRGNGQYIATIVVTPTAPSISPTLAINQQALKLPDSTFAVTFVDLGTQLMVGAQKGATYASRGSQNFANIYPWNKQLGTLGNPGLANLPIVLNENGINAMISDNNKLYVQAGLYGSVFMTDSTNWEKIKSLPYSKAGTDVGSNVYANALAMSQHHTLLVGLSIGSVPSGITARAGIFEIDLDASDAKGNATYPTSLRTISTLQTSNPNAPLSIGMVRSIDYRNLRLSWQNGAVYGVDTTDEFPYEHGAIIEGFLDHVAVGRTLKTLTDAKFSFAAPLAFGQAWRMSYRKMVDASFTVVKTWGFDTALMTFQDGTTLQPDQGIGGDTVNGVTVPVVAFSDDAGIADAEFLQIRLELFQIRSAQVLYGTNLNLIDVEFK